MQNLIDGDLASNNGGWQWSASTGVDPAPYFRIFNPYLQSEKVWFMWRFILSDIELTFAPRPTPKATSYACSFRS